MHEDDTLLVLDKPAGLVVHPGAGVQSGTLVHALLHHAPAIATVGGEGRPGIVHRLDKDTSGLLVVAKTEEAYLALVEALRERRGHARSTTRSSGATRARTEGFIDLPIGRDQKDRKRMAVVPARAGGPRARAGACWSASASPRWSRPGSRPAARTRSGCTWRPCGTRWSAIRSTAAVSENR